MPKPKIRHLALHARDPQKLAKFYEEVFEMEIIHKSGGPRDAHFVSDGYLTLAILPHRLEGNAAHGLNHFGFSVPDRAAVMQRLVAAGVEAPKQRPADRPFAEYRGVDLEGNWFDISEHGFETVETATDRSQRKVQA